MTPDHQFTLYHFLLCDVVDSVIWTRVIDLYPSLVDCTRCQCPDVCTAVHDSLMQYKDLLSPPSAGYTTNGSV